MLFLLAALACTDTPADTASPVDTAPEDTGEEILDTGLENQAPVLAIAEPLEGTAGARGATMRLSAAVLDDKDGPEVLELVWSSDVDGELELTPVEGEDYAYTTVLGEGAHLLTLTVTDKGGLSVQDTRNVTVNRAPSAPELLLEPALPSTLDDLVLTIPVPSEDPEGEVPELEVLWFVGEVLLPELSELTIPAEQTTRDEVWRAEVTPFDSDGPGPTVTAEVVIQNSPPSTPVVRMDASFGSDPLVCSFSVPAIDPDGEELSVDLAWEADGAVYPDDFPDAVGLYTTLMDDDTVPVADLGLAESFTCTATLSDGEFSVSDSASAGYVNPNSLFDEGYWLEYSYESILARNYLLGHPVTVSSDMTVTHLGIIGKRTTSNGQIALYTDASGQPDALVTESSLQAIVSGTNTFDVPDAPIVAGTYWVMAVYDSTAYVGENRSRDTIYYVSMSGGSAMPDPLSGLRSYSGYRHNYYLTGY